MFGLVAVTSSVSNGGPPLAGHAAGARLLATRGELGNAAGVSVTILDQLAEGMTKLVVVAAAAYGRGEPRRRGWFVDRALL